MDMLTVVGTLAGSLVVVLVAFVSLFVFYMEEQTLKRWMPRLIAVAVGVLLGDAFLHLLPDALESGANASMVFMSTLGGILCFYLIEHVLHWKHDHELVNSPRDPNTPASLHDTPASFARMNLLGDGIHNFVDGILIAGSFLTDPMLGVATTIAIVVHEIPQEISDIAVLVHGGYSKRRAVFLNVLCATACIAGAVMTLLLSQIMELSLGALLAFTAGGFIYIATTDLMPLLRQAGARLSLPAQATATMVGVLSMQAILWLETFTG
ncbi:MAG: ZIP family metal transporter [Gammaproteobacteria bacterium]|nr:ZIP family metal transporter [Gammaproteobacteria bacterium]